MKFVLTRDLTYANELTKIFDPDRHRLHDAFDVHSRRVGQQGVYPQSGLVLYKLQGLSDLLFSRKLQRRAKSPSRRILVKHRFYNCSDYLFEYLIQPASHLTTSSQDIVLP